MRVVMRSVVILIFVAGSAWALPNTFVQEGLLTDAQNRPLNGNYSIGLKLYASAEGNDVLFEETHAAVPIVNGYYAVQVGSEAGLPMDTFERAEVYLGMTVDGGRELAPRIGVTFVPAAMFARNALNVSGAITPLSVSVGGNVVIDEQGNWVGAPTGLRGPKGDDGANGANGAPGVDGLAGPEGIRGERGPAGGDGGDGSPDTPEQVLAKMLEVDGAGSGLIADSVDGLQANQFMRSDTDTGTTGSVQVAGKMTSDSVETKTVRVNNARGQTGISILGNVKLTDNDILGVQRFNFNDAGPDGRIDWSGTQARIYVAPMDDANADGVLRLQNDDGIALESNVLATGDMTVSGALAVGAPTGSTKLFVQDDSAVSTGATIRNHRADTNSRPFIKLEGITPRAQGATGKIQLRTGAEAGGADTRNEGALEFLVSTGGAGSERSAMMIQHNGEVGVGVADPLGKFHVANVDARSKPSIISGSVPGLYLFDTEKSNGEIRYASFMIEADGSKLYIGSRSSANAGTPGSGSRSVTITENGFMGLNTRSPSERLHVKGNAIIDGNLQVTGDLLGADGQPVSGGGAELPSGNLAAYLNFNAGSGDVIADSSGNQNNFSFANGATWTTDGVRGSAVKFDGNDDYIYRDNTGWNGYFTISLWIKTGSSSGYWTSESNPGPGDCIRLRGGFVNNKANFWFWDNSNAPAERSITGVTSITDNKWHHIAVTLDKDADRLRLFVDGVQENSITTEGNDRAHSRLWVGGIHGGCAGNHTINGSIDEYRLYHRALGADEIRTLYEAANDSNAIYVRPDGNVGIGTESPDALLDVAGALQAETIQADLVNAGRVSTKEFDVGDVSEATAGRVSAAAVQSREREIANFTLNDHHWSGSNGFFVEAFSRYYDSGYVKYYIDTGYRSIDARKIETHGDLGTRFGLRIVKGDRLADRGGHPEYRYHVYGQASHYSQWNVVVRTGSTNLVTGRNAERDGEVAVLESSDHRNIDDMTNNSYESNIRGDLNVSGTLTAKNLNVQGSLTAESLTVNGAVQHAKSAMNAARSICYSALTGTGNHSIIMVPLPNNGTNLDDHCHARINGGWHASGIAKSNYYYQNCGGGVDNDSYGGGYTSFTSEAYFEANPANFTSCNASNAFICCSPFFAN